MNITNFTNSSTSHLQRGTPFDGRTADHPEPHVLRVLSLLLFSVIILASLIGNTLVLKAVIELPSRCKPFTYHLVANLAVAEIVSSVCQPFAITYQEMYSWVFGGFSCKLLIPLQVLAVIVVTSDMARHRGLSLPENSYTKEKALDSLKGANHWWNMARSPGTLASSIRDANSCRAAIWIQTVLFTVHG